MREDLVGLEDIHPEQGHDGVRDGQVFFAHEALDGRLKGAELLLEIQRRFKQLGGDGAEFAIGSVEVGDVARPVDYARYRARDARLRDNGGLPAFMACARRTPRRVRRRRTVRAARVIATRGPTRDSDSRARVAAVKSRLWSTQRLFASKTTMTFCHACSGACRSPIPEHVDHLFRTRDRRSADELKKQNR